MKSSITIATFGFILIILLLVLGGCDAYTYSEKKGTDTAASATSAFQTSDAATWAAATFEANLTPFISGFQTRTSTPTSTWTPTPSRTPTATSTGIRQSSAPAVFVFYPLGPGRNGQANGAVTLVDQGDQTKVVLDVKPDSPAVEQPANIHSGACPNVGAVKYPLNNVVNGNSTTVISATLASLKTGGYAVNVQKSATEPNVFVACVAIK